MVSITNRASKSGKDGSGTPDARLARSGNDEDSRLSGAGDRTQVEPDRLDDEAFEALMSDWEFDKLPALPKMPGWRPIWLSTTHPQDTIPRRMRLGYVPVSPDEAPELKQLVEQIDGSQALIKCNEMVAFKISEDRWQRMMKRFHHDMPLHEEEGIKERMMQMRDEIKSKGGRVLMEEGTAELGKARQARFA